MDNPHNFIEEMFHNGLLINKGMLNKELQPTLIHKIESEQDLIVLNEDYMEVLEQQTHLVDWYEIDRYRVDAEKDRNDDLYQAQLQQFKQSSLMVHAAESLHQQAVSSLEVELGFSESATNFSTTFSVSAEGSAEEPSINVDTESSRKISYGSVLITESYENIAHKYTITDFTNFFLSRYRFLESLLRSRREMQNVLTIVRVLNKQDKETVSIIGLVQEIQVTKNNNLIVTLEDLTGSIKIVISKSKRELFAHGKELVHDEVVGIVGVCGDKIIFAEDIIWPDLPVTHEMKKSDKEEYVAFLSDLHIGSKLFLNEEFTKFLRWINAQAGNEEQRDLARKIKYIFIAGDLVDGVGVYPNQEEELEIDDIVEQYKEFCRLIKQIPADKQIIICPGNHDVVHLAEPQSVFYNQYTADLSNIKNVLLVSNPAYITIGKTKNFSGFDVLLYHGFSFDYYVNNVESIRNKGGYHRADLVMKFLLKRRHLAPSFKSTPYFPAHKEDPLLIKRIPDFMITGHIHYSNVANYKGVTMISGSCWQAKTSFQEKLGHEPEPGRVPVVNLNTREIKLLKFV